MLELERNDEVSPKCPPCSEVLPTLWFQEISGVLGRRYIYFCPACRSVLGVSHRKGFLMG